MTTWPRLRWYQVRIPAETKTPSLLIFSERPPVGFSDLQVDHRRNFRLLADQPHSGHQLRPEVARFSLLLLLCQALHHADQICPTGEQSALIDYVFFWQKNVLISFFKAQLLRELSTQPFNINRTLLYSFAHFRFFDHNVNLDFCPGCAAQLKSKEVEQLACVP